MKISKQSVLVSMSLALMLAFSLLTGCVSTQGRATLSDDTIRLPTENVNEFWDNKEWEELSKAEQELWSLVGFTEAVWIGDEKNPPEQELYWKQIAPEKRAVLEKLGYTESFWNNGDPE
ncbi:MAG: hypothetical protein GY729_04015 [Desulfobacteraceae bacterium]|nr:hypothetical protein [Desulfobacteraceae bacterium]